MPSPQGFHHVAMNVKNFDKSIQFYTDVLGLTKGRSWSAPPNRAIMLDTGNGSYLELFEKTETDETKGTIVHFALRTDNCDAMLEKVRASGAEITVESKNVDIPSEPVFPVRIAFFKGPDGEIIELFQERNE